MNINDLTEQMQNRALSWDRLYTREGRAVEVGTSIRDWLRVVESLTAKLKNPRKDEERILNDHIENLRMQVNELRQQVSSNGEKLPKESRAQ